MRDVTLSVTIKGNLPPFPAIRLTLTESSSYGFLGNFADSVFHLHPIDIQGIAYSDPVIFSIHQAGSVFYISLSFSFTFGRDRVRVYVLVCVCVKEHEQRDKNTYFET